MRQVGDSLESLLWPDEPFAARLLRRSRGIGLQLILFVLLTALSPLLVACAAVTDLLLWLRRRKPWMATRLLAFAWWGLFCELRGLLGLTWIRLVTIGRPPHVDRRVFRLRRQWLGGHLRGMRRIFRLRFEIDGLEHAGRGPLVILMRHASTVDTLLPETFVSIEHDMWSRYVLKRELLALPTIDIGRRWVPTVFVRRGQGDPEGEAQRVRTLATGLAPDEALIIYPEGTLYSAGKLARAQQVIAERQPSQSALAARLRHVLPPRMAGTIGALQAAPTADVVVFGHLGLDRFEYPRDMWRGDLVGTTVRMKLWRYPAADVPRDSDDALTRWMYERWFELDDWIDRQRNREASTPPTTGPLPLTGERTVPGVPEENYWFRRHETAYRFALPLVAGKRVLEVGCGEGYGTALLATEAADVVGIDYDALTAAHAAAAYPQAHFVRANLAALPFASESVDVVATLQVIEHVWNHREFVAECLRVLRPGGSLMVTTPNRLTFSPGLDEPVNPFHTKEFTAAELVELLVKSGFDVTSVHGLHAGERLVGLDRTHGGSFVDAQLATPPDGWAERLRADVRSITCDDFAVLSDTERDVDESLDLVVIASRPIP
jgi:SAM-dependent methyltransferase